MPKLSPQICDGAAPICVYAKASSHVCSRKRPPVCVPKKSPTSLCQAAPSCVCATDRPQLCARQHPLICLCQSQASDLFQAAPPVCLCHSLCQWQSQTLRLCQAAPTSVYAKAKSHLCASQRPPMSVPKPGLRCVLGSTYLRL